MTTTERAYLAGLVDGEGCISMFSYQAGTYQFGSMRRRGTPKYRTLVRLHIGICYGPVILWIANELGGRPFRRNVSRYNPNTKLIWTIQWSGVRAVAILKLIWPYLRVKRRQAAIAMKWIALSERTRDFKGRWGGPAYPAWVTRRRDGYLRRMHDLNRRGATPSR